MKTVFWHCVLGRGAAIVLLMVDRDMILYGKDASRPLEEGENLKVSTPKSLSAGSKKSG
jgi:hypothetical protein